MVFNRLLIRCTIELTETQGLLDIALNASFSLEYSNNINDDNLKITVNAINSRVRIRYHCQY